MTILAAGVYTHAAVLDIADCSGHVARGNKKDAKYIITLFEPLINIINPAKIFLIWLPLKVLQMSRKQGISLRYDFPVSLASTVPSTSRPCSLTTTSR